MKRINIRRFVVVLAVFAVIVAMNTIVFAATTNGTYNVSISGITRNEYSYSLGYTKTNSEEYAYLRNLTGASTSLGVRFLVKVENGQNTSFCTETKVYQEGATELKLAYEYPLRITSYRIKVIQADYPRVSSATMTTDFTP